MIGQMSPAQARVVDPVNTKVARGYKNPQMMGGRTLFPQVPVPALGGKVIEFGREDFELIDTERPPGGNTQRVQYGYLGKEYALTGHGLEGVVPWEIQHEGQAGPGIDQSRLAIGRTQKRMWLKTEVECADLAQNPDNYANSNKLALTGSDRWDAGGDPISVAEHVREVVRERIAIYPNVAVIAPKVFSSMRVNPALLSRRADDKTRTITLDYLKELWEVDEVVVGQGIYSPRPGMATQDIWENSVVFAYVDITDLADQGSPSYGYTYQLSGFPVVEKPYQERNPKSWIYPVSDYRKPVISAADAGFLLTNLIG